MEDLSREELLDFIKAYNNYIINFMEEHDIGMCPISIYEFYDNEYQLMKTEKEDTYKSLRNHLEMGLLDEIDMCCECCFEEEIKLTSEQKIQIVKEMINSEEYLWQMLNERVMDYIRDEIGENKNDK